MNGSVHLAKLQAHGLKPNREADKATLARRLSVGLTGLPVEPQLLEAFLKDDSEAAYDKLVSAMLDSPHFGERWARHWMDVVHYTRIRMATNGMCRSKTPGVIAITSFAPLTPTYRISD